MLAIPVLRCRVAPVLNWCSRIQIFPEGPSQEGEVQELILPHLEAAERLQVLRDKGVNTLICGALSADLLRYAGRLGLTVVSGVAGEVHEVVQSYWQNTLDHPKFWLPGCRGLRRYRSGWLKGRGPPCNGQARTRSRGRNNLLSSPTPEQGLGPGDSVSARSAAPGSPMNKAPLLRAGKVPSLRSDDGAGVKGSR